MFLEREKFLLQLEGVVQDHLGERVLVESLKNDHKGFQLLLTVAHMCIGANALQLQC